MSNFNCLKRQKMTWQHSHDREKESTIFPLMSSRCFYESWWIKITTKCCLCIYFLPKAISNFDDYRKGKTIIETALERGKIAWVVEKEKSTLKMKEMKNYEFETFCFGAKTNSSYSCFLCALECAKFNSVVKIFII